MVNNKNIRLSTVNVLKANANLASVTIHNSKITPNLYGKLPAIGVFVTNATADNANHTGPGFVKTLDINIEIAVAGNEGSYANTSDDLMFWCKESLFANTAWTGQFENVAGYTEETNLEEAGEQPIALSRLVISCELVEL